MCWTSCRRVWESCGAGVLTARNARAALAYIDTTPKLDAVITDIAMPDMDGAELARRVRRHPSRSRLSITAITAFYEQHANQPEFDGTCRNRSISTCCARPL